MSVTGYDRNGVIAAVASTLSASSTWRVVEYGPEASFEDWYQAGLERFPALYLEAGPEEYLANNNIQFTATPIVRIYCIYDHDAGKNALSRESDYIEEIIQLLLADPTLGGVVSDIRPVRTEFEIQSVKHPYRALRMDWTMWAYFERS